MIRIPTLLSLFLLLVGEAQQKVAAQSPALKFTSVATGLSQPLAIARPPADPNRLFIVQKGGIVRIWNGTSLLPGSFLNISSIISTSGERGLLSMAFHPAYATNRLFYVFYTNTSGSLVLARYRCSATDSNAADATSGVVLKTIPHPTYDNHNGGTIHFGSDGFLYWSTGDGGGGGDPDNNAQDGTSLLGKMLRFAVSSDSAGTLIGPAPGNKAATPADFDSSILQFGLRNPFRWSFDRLNGDMWIADVGQGAWEEVDYTTLAAAPGRDWGWRCREGAHVYSTTTTCSTGATDPVFEYDHGPTGGFSITGGYVYRGTAYPAMYGKYICSDFVSNRAFIVTPGATAPYAGTFQNSIPAGIAGYGEDAAGELYAVSLSGGTLFAISDTSAPLSVAGIISFTGDRRSRADFLTWTASDRGVDRYEIERSTDGRSFAKVSVTESIEAIHSKYSVRLDMVTPGETFYRLRIVNQSGGTSYSPLVRMPADGASASPLVQIHPVPAREGERARMTVSTALQRAWIVDATGRTVWTSGALAPGEHSLLTNRLSAGTYLLGYASATGGYGAVRFTVVR